MLIYWVGIYAFDDYAGHLGYFSLLPVFSTHVLVWSALGASGFAISSILMTRFVESRKLTLNHLTILGLIIGSTHLIAQLKVDYFLVMLPLPMLLAWLYSTALYHFNG